MKTATKEQMAQTIVYESKKYFHFTENGFNNFKARLVKLTKADLQHALDVLYVKYASRPDMQKAYIASIW